MAFKTSVNIKFDIGNDEFLRRYIPTPSHTEAMKGIVDGFLSKEANRSHIIIGPYGTGKSLLVNVIGSIVAKLVEDEQINALIKKMEPIDDYAHFKLNGLKNLKKTYLPIILSGNEGRFRQSIISGIIKKLKENEIEIMLPGLTSKVVDSISIWKSQFPQTYDTFCEKLVQDGKEIGKWIEDIKKQNEIELEYFSTIYPLLTSGSLFDIDYDHNFVGQMEYIITVLEANNLGVFIVYDEFARFLQGLSNARLNETMQDLQDLAELANRSNAIHFLLITHKSLRLYFNSFNEDISKEFQRIEKRFRQYHLQSDQTTFLRIAEIIISENIEMKPSVSNSDFTNIQLELRKYPLFPSLDQTQRETLVIEGMYPLHPVSLFMLPHLTRVFGQNERTLFTFLESEETGGFYNHINNSKKYYLAYQLFDYFFPDNSEFINEEVSEHFMLYKKALARIPNNIKNKKQAHNIIKIIALWNICSLQSEQHLTNEFLCFSSHMKEKELDNLIAILSENKIIRFNRINNYWELFSGNSIDLQEAIDKEKQLIVLDDTLILDKLNKSLNTKFYTADRFNDDRGMTRYASVLIVREKEVLEGKFPVPKDIFDLLIYYVLLDNLQNLGKVESILLEKSANEQLLFFVHPVSVKSIEKDISSSLALESLKKNKSLFSEDKGVREELEILINESNYIITKYLSEMARFCEGNNWIINSEIREVSTKFELTEILSNKCNQLYRLTPVILNDNFNRKSISGTQKSAAVVLIDRILEHTGEEQFGIIGTGPEYAIYASIFKNNGRLDLNVNRLNFNDIEYLPYQELRTQLIGRLDANNAGNLQDIIELFTNPAFGIRLPVVSVLLVSLLRDRWNEFALYHNEMYVPGLDGSKLFEIIFEGRAKNYRYIYEHYDERYIEFFNQIEVHFNDSLEYRLVNHSRLIYICGTLMKWIRMLPKFTQTSEQVLEEFLWLRETIKHTEINPQQSFALIFERFQGEFDEFMVLKEYGENVLMEMKDNIQQEILRITNMPSVMELEKWAIEQNAVFTGSSNKFIRNLVAAFKAKSDSVGWIDIFAEIYIGIIIDDWSDTTNNLLIRQLEFDYQMTINTNSIKSYSSITTNDPEVITIQLNEKKKIIKKAELSIKSTAVYNNIERLINSAGRNVPKYELEFLIYQLFENHVIKSE
ncbi:MAG: hypothetical protein WDZ91_03595 [Paenibacillaceae bacterium]